MKKLFILFSILLSMVDTKAFAYDIAVENADGVTIYYKYINDGKELEVADGFGSKYSGDVVIPEEVTYMNRTRRVTAIGNKAFSNSSSNLKSVIIPNSVTVIGKEAFSGCNKITSISIPNSVTTIGKEAFKFCHKLTSVVIPNSVITIGERAFDSCNSLTSVTIPNSVSTIGDRAFFGCALTSVIIPNSITSLKGTFCGCTNLTSISIPNSVTYIGDGAFNGCKNLTTLTIPNSVTTIGDDAFSWSGLTSVTIPSSVTYIEDGQDGAFCGCSYLTSVVVEKGNPVYDSRENSNAIIETATNTLILGCKNSVIPNSVTQIGESAFCSCHNLTTLIIGSFVTSLGDYAFESCSSLTSITIPNSVTTIGFAAFRNCNDLSIVISKIDNPFVIDKLTFPTNTYNNATLYVPKGSEEAYKKTKGWKEFKYIKAIGEDGNTDNTNTDDNTTDDNNIDDDKTDDGISDGDSGWSINIKIKGEDIAQCDINNIESIEFTEDGLYIIINYKDGKIAKYDMSKFESIDFSEKGGNNEDVDDDGGGGSPSVSTFTITYDGEMNEVENTSWINPLFGNGGYDKGNYFCLDNYPLNRGQIHIIFPYDQYQGNVPPSYFTVGYSDFGENATDIEFISAEMSAWHGENTSGSAKVTKNDGKNITIQFNKYAFEVNRSGKSHNFVLDGTLTFQAYLYD